MIILVKNTCILYQVRAGSLQELVYKQGQAGVTKATVTVVFSNKDKNQSPVGYEAYDEIAVCRQVLNHYVVDERCIIAL